MLQGGRALFWNEQRKRKTFYISTWHLITVHWPHFSINKIRSTLPLISCNSTVFVRHVFFLNHNSNCLYVKPCNLLAAYVGRTHRLGPIFYSLYFRMSVSFSALSLQPQIITNVVLFFLQTNVWKNCSLYYFCNSFSYMTGTVRPLPTLSDTYVSVRMLDLLSNWYNYMDVLKWIFLWPIRSTDGLVTTVSWFVNHSTPFE